MWLKSICAIALYLHTSYAFSNTSPVFAFSTLDLDFHSPIRDSVVKSSDVDFLLKEIARACHTEALVVVSQPGVTAANYESENATPFLRRRLIEAEARRSAIVEPDVLGAIRRDQVLREAVMNCGMTERSIDIDGKHYSVPSEYPQALTIDFPAPPSTNLRNQLLENDRILDGILEGLDGHSYTVVYTTIPSETNDEQEGLVSQDEPESSQQHPVHLYDYDTEDPLPEAFHSDLKRDLDSHIRRQAKNSSSSGAPLFESYNFFSPGIFMGLLATFLLLSILYVGISAIGGMEVTYAAFNKEMGPAAQKKQ